MVGRYYSWCAVRTREFLPWFVIHELMKDDVGWFRLSLVLGDVIIHKGPSEAYLVSWDSGRNKSGNFEPEYTLLLSYVL